MQIWFCQSCGARVTKADLGNVPGLTASTLVYCKDCLKKENRADRVQRSLKRDHTEPLRPPSKGVRRKSTRNVNHIVQRNEPGEAPEEDELEPRPNRRARHSASNIPRAGSKTIRIAAIAGAVLLLAGIVLVNIDLSPQPERAAAPVHETPQPQKPPPSEAPRKPAVDEHAADDAYEALDKNVAALPPAEKGKKLELIDAYLMAWNESHAAVRARTLREKIESADVSPAAEADPPQMAYLPMPSPLALQQTKAYELAIAGDFKNAQIEFDRALKLNPDDYGLLTGRAELARQTDDYQTCFELSDRMAEAHPDKWVPLALRALSGYALGKETLYKVDVAKMLQLCDLDAEYKRTVKAWVWECAWRGRIVVQGRLLEKRDPKTAAEFRQRGYFRTVDNRFPEAEADLRKAMALDPANETENAFRALQHIAEAKHDPRTRLNLCREWVKLAPRSPVALNDLAWQLLMSEDESLRNPQEALPLSQRACELRPNNYLQLDTLALAYFNNNDVLKAIACEKQVIALLPDAMTKEQREVYQQRLTEFEFVKPPDP